MKNEENIPYVVAPLIGSLIGFGFCTMILCEIAGVENLLLYGVYSMKVLLFLAAMILSIVCLGIAYGSIRHLIRICFIKKKDIKKR